MEFFDLYGESFLQELRNASPSEAKELLFQQELRSLEINPEEYEGFRPEVKAAILQLVEIKAHLNVKIARFIGGSHAAEIAKNFGTVLGSDTMFNAAWLTYDVSMFGDENEDGIPLGFLIFIGGVAIAAGKSIFDLLGRGRKRRRLQRDLENLRNAATLVSKGDIEYIPLVMTTIYELSNDYVALGYFPKRPLF